MKPKQLKAFNELRESLVKRFSTIDPYNAGDMANDVMISLIESRNIQAIGEAGMDLEDIVKKFPEIEAADYIVASAALKKITFTKIPETMQEAAREEITDSFRGKVPGVEKKFTRHDPKILRSITEGQIEVIKEEEEKENPDANSRPKTYTRFLTNSNQLKA